MASEAMTREVTDADGITWSCVQVYTGIYDKQENQAAAQVDEKNNTYWVVCTPSGGAKSVRLQLPGEWQSSSNAALLQSIEAQR